MSKIGLNELQLIIKTEKNRGEFMFRIVMQMYMKIINFISLTK